MTSPDSAEYDRRRIRIGLAFLTVVVIGALLGAVLLDSAVGKMVMIGILLFTILRAFTITRALRRDRR